MDYKDGSYIEIKLHAQYLLPHANNIVDSFDTFIEETDRELANDANTLSDIANKVNESLLDKTKKIDAYIEAGFEISPIQWKSVFKKSDKILLELIPTDISARAYLDYRDGLTLDSIFPEGNCKNLFNTVTVQDFTEFQSLLTNQLFINCANDIQANPDVYSGILGENCDITTGENCLNSLYELTTNSVFNILYAEFTKIKFGYFFDINQRFFLGGNLFLNPGKVGVKSFSFNDNEDNSENSNVSSPNDVNDAISSIRNGKSTFYANAEFYGGFQNSFMDFVLGAHNLVSPEIKYEDVTTIKLKPYVSVYLALFSHKEFFQFVWREDFLDNFDETGFNYSVRDISLQTNSVTKWLGVRAGITNYKNFDLTNTYLGFSFFKFLNLDFVKSTDNIETDQGDSLARSLGFSLSFSGFF